MSDHFQLSRRDHYGRMLGSVGVVFGDIGTSVLYACNESFFGVHRLDPNPANIFGILSLFFWSLTLIVGVKYVLMIMHADNRGEGGIFSLLALINGARSKIGKHKMAMIWGLIIFGAALLLADGMITPAISVISSIEGLKVVTPGLQRWVVPITVLILVALFIVQPFGTHRIGMVFGPIMVVWFIGITAISVPHLFQHPEVFKALSPTYAIGFMMSHGLRTLFTLGAVVLCVTGGEALYADMGHFGRKPITHAWWLIVFPALTLNYLAQGARLLSATPLSQENIFYSMVPQWGLIPMIVLATAATVIASQALISGSFSLIQQAIALGAFPRQRVVHTNAELEGQIYLPFVNWSLMIGCICLVIFFKTASALAAAYGIAVTGTMAISTIGFYFVARYVWGWRHRSALPVCLFFLLIDLTFFNANLLKFLSGGYVPIVVALAVFTIMHCWYWGRGFIAKCYQVSDYFTVKRLIQAKDNPATIQLNRSLVVLASRPVSALSDTIPPALQSRLDHLGAIYKHITILSVIQHPGVREIEEEQRFLINVLYDDPVRGSVVTVQLFYGYMQDPDLSHMLPKLVDQGVIRLSDDPKSESFCILSGAERLIVDKLPLLDFLRLTFFRILLRNANTVLKYFNLESFPDVSTEVVNLGQVKQIRSQLKTKTDKTAEPAVVERYL